MERILPAKVHNKFEIEVTDAATGKLKQSVTCYNIILNSFFTRLVNRSSKLGYIFLGTGTGTPVITRTSLFSHLCAISATTVETVKAYPTSYVRKKIVASVVGDLVFTYDADTRTLDISPLEAGS